MRNTKLASVLVLGTSLLSGCADSPLAVEQTTLASTAPSLAVRTGETFVGISITNPSTRSISLALGGTTQMSGILKYSLGGTLPTAPYAKWRSNDTCVASVTSASPSWGLVKGLKSGTALIIAEAF